MSPHSSSLLFTGATSGLSRRDLRAFLRTLESQVAGNRSFNCLIADDRELQRLNREFLRHDYPTDVLSFPSGADDSSLGEIAISFDRAKEQAAQHRHGVQQEIEILMLHGLLHLLGMDHEIDGGRMARAERKWRAALNLPRGLIERAPR